MDMVERVARAIYPTAWVDGSEYPERLATKRRRSITAARAAIAAMREPTEEMVQSVEWYYVSGGKNQYLRDLYRIMIDVALGTLPPKKLWSVIEDEKRAALTSSEPQAPSSE